MSLENSVSVQQPEEQCRMNPLSEAKAFSLIYDQFGKAEALKYLGELKTQNSSAYKLIQTHEPFRSQWKEARWAGV